MISEIYPSELNNHDSEEKIGQLEAIIQSMSDGLFVLDKNNNFSFLNQGGKDFFYQPEKVAKNGDSFENTKYYDLQDKELSVEDMVGSRVLKGERVKHCRIKAVRPDKTVYFSMSGNPVYDGKGNISSAVICCRDITEQVERDLLIFQRKEQLELLFENISDGIYISDKDGNLLMMNSEGKRQVYQPDSIRALGEKHSTVQYFDMEGNEITLDKMPGVKALRGEKVKNERVRIQQPDKEIYIEANATLILDDNGDLNIVVLCTHDITNLIEKENAITQQKEQLEAIIENMSDALLFFDKDGNFTKMNKCARDTYVHIFRYFKKMGDGLKQSEYFDANGFLIPFEDVPAQRVKRGEKLVGYRMKIKDGDINLYIDVNGTPIYDKKGNFVAGILCCSDVTEKATMEEALKESEAQYKELFNNMPIGKAQYKIVTDAFGKPIDYLITEANPAYERMTGFKRKKLIGKKATKLFLGLENSSFNWIGIIGDVALTGKSVSMEVYSDVMKRWYENYYYCPKPGYTASIFSDITERKNNEEELWKTKERLQEAQDFAHLGYWELEAKSGKPTWSDELFRIYGFKPQEFVPTINEFLKIIHPEDKEYMINVLNQSLKGKELELDLRVIRQDNEIIWIHEKVKSEYNAFGNLVRTYGVVQDITRQKLSELKLKESEEKFKELAENLGEVSSSGRANHIY